MLAPDYSHIVYEREVELSMVGFWYVYGDVFYVPCR